MLTYNLASQFLAGITNTLPRLSAYGELYPTDRMVQQLAGLYATLLEFLRRAFLYYRKGNWKGTICMYVLMPQQWPFLVTIPTVIRVYIDRKKIYSSNKFCNG